MKPLRFGDESYGSEWTYGAVRQHDGWHGYACEVKLVNGKRWAPVIFNGYDFPRRLQADAVSDGVDIVERYRDKILTGGPA